MGEQVSTAVVASASTAAAAAAAAASIVIRQTLNAVHGVTYGDASCFDVTGLRSESWKWIPLSPRVITFRPRCDPLYCSWVVLSDHLQGPRHRSALVYHPIHAHWTWDRAFDLQALYIPTRPVVLVPTKKRHLTFDIMNLRWYPVTFCQGKKIPFLYITRQSEFIFSL